MIRERDWILRVAKQLAELIARAMRLGQERREGEGQAILQGACGELFGVEYRILSMVDGASAVDLLGEPSRGLAFAQLLEAMAKLEHEPLRREARLRHALEVVQAVRAKAPASTEASSLEARLLEAVEALEKHAS